MVQREVQFLHHLVLFYLGPLFDSFKQGSMMFLKISSMFVAVLVFLSGLSQVKAYRVGATCSGQGRCHGKHLLCPEECPMAWTMDPKAKACYLNCDSPPCEAVCKHYFLNCDGPGGACYDPRFVGSGGIVFYFHGKSNENFSLISDSDLQINSRFIGHRPAGRTRDFTWIQSLGILFNSQTFSLEATKAATWDGEVDHLKFTYNEKELVIPEGSLSDWYSPEKDVIVRRMSSRNNAVVSLKDKAEILINVVPVTKEDDKIHKYQIPADDCFVHLEVQFRLFNLSPKIDGVLGRTYRPDFENPAKPGVAMPVLGGEEKYRTTSLLSADCKSCIFSPQNGPRNESWSVDHGALDCTRGASAGYGIVCRK